jgi:hypothetical protein
VPTAPPSVRTSSRYCANITRTSSAATTEAPGT